MPAGPFFFALNQPAADGADKINIPRCRGRVIRVSFYPSSVSFADTFPPRGRLEGLSFNTANPQGRLLRPQNGMVPPVATVHGVNMPPAGGKMVSRI